MRRLRIHAGRLAIASTTWHEALFGLYRMPESSGSSQICPARLRKLTLTVLAAASEPTIPVAMGREVSPAKHSQFQRPSPLANTVNV